MKSIVPEHAGPRVDSQLTGAYAVTAVSLRAWAELVSNFASQGTNRRLAFAVEFQGSSPASFDQIEAVVALRNPATTPIRTIHLFAMSEERTALITLDAAGGLGDAPISIQAVSESIDDLTRFLVAAEKEAKNIATWYANASRFSKLVTRYASRVPNWLYLAVALTGIGLLVWDAASRNHWRSLATDAVSSIEKLTAAGKALDPSSEKALESLKHALETNPQSSLTISLALGVLYFVGGTALAFAMPLLFPSIEFLIGDGVQRHDLRKQRRAFLVVTVFISGVLIPLVRKALLGL